MQVLLYDGLCGFCDRTVRFILARDPGGSLRFASLQGEFAARMMQQRPDLREIDSLILLDVATNGDAAGVSVRSDAVLGIARYLGGPWRVASVLKVLPKALRDLGYDLFARHRYGMFGRYDACAIPTAEQRSRFFA